MSVQLRPRGVVRAFNLLTFALAAILVALRLPHDAALATRDGRILAAVAVLLVAIAVRYSVPLRGTRGKRAHVEDSVSLDLPITLSLFLVIGGAAAALATLLGFPLSRLLRRRADWPALALAGGSRAIFFLAGDLIRPHIPASAFDYSLSSFGVFIGLVMLGLLAFIYLWHLPATAWRERAPVERLWRRYSRDRHLWGLLAVQAVWAYACCEFMLRSPLLALLAWLPIPIIAVLGRALFLARSDAHRLRMTRDAITAMLVQRDPIPQINSVVAASIGGSARETVQVVSAIGRDAEWRVVTAVGPPRDAAFDDLRAEAVRRLHARRGGWLAAEDGARSVVAAGAYDEKGALVGALCALRYARDGRIGNPDRLVQTARELAPLLRDLVNIQRAQEAAEIDGLTQLANRSTILDYVRATLEGEPAEPGALLLLDIDHFKAINDRLGHLAGDRCLRTVGEIVAANVRDGDRAGRFGGEEFLVVMPHATREMALSVAERLRSAIEACGLVHGDGAPVTCSIGVAALDVGETLESALARADRALYAAKRHGRNRVVELTA